MSVTAILSPLTLAALAADEKLTPEQKREIVWLILFVVAAGITLIVCVVLLMRVNRRQIARLASGSSKAAVVGPDIWKAGGDRLTARMSPFPKADASDAHLEADGPLDGQRQGGSHPMDDAPPFTDDDPDDDDEKENDETSPGR